MKKWIKSIILASVGALLLISGLLSWNLYFSKFKIFYEQEDLFLKTVQRYFSMNQKYLPKTGEVREITLQDMYDGDHIDDLYIPKTNKLCDSEKSLIRVYKNDKGEYEYFTYLKCGKFESDIDNEGPIIELNGDSTVYVALGTNYNELGVKNVADNIDDDINVSDVIIDSSKLNVNKIGSYDVTYTIRDSSYNKTVITRKVVVSENLTEIVKKMTSKNTFNNNYILFSGMLWRIVNVSEDGTVKIITDEAITNLRANYDKYEGSNIDSWLNNVFYKSLHNPDKYIVENTYCVGKIKSVYDYSTECSETITSKIGLLNASDYFNATSINANSLHSTGFMLANKIGDNYLDVPYISNNIDGVSTDVLAPIRPVVNLKSDLFVVSGNGTFEKPYKLNDYNYGVSNEKISNRLVGEYIEYSGINFRIIGIDSNNNVRVISSEPWTVQPYDNKLYISVSDVKNLKFNMQDENNPGYILNNEYTDYIDMRSIVDTKYEIPLNNRETNFTGYQKEKITAKILLPKTYELFASPGNYNKSALNLYIDRSTNDELIFMANGQNGKVFELNKTAFNSYNIKIVLTLKGTLKIENGNGTINDPYGLK